MTARIRVPRRLAGAALVLVGIGALLISTASAGETRARLLGSNYGVNAGAGQLRDISAHNSPSVARSPVDPRLLVVANRIDLPRYSCALHVSRDAGATWSQTPIPVPAAEEPKCYAPDIAFGADGTLYLVFVTLAGNGNVPHAVWLSSSRDGRSLTKPRRLLPGLAFGVRLVADPRRAGRLYLTWLQAKQVGLYRFTQDGNPIRAMRSDDGGRTWTTRTRVNALSRRRAIAPVPAVGPRGELYVLYLDLGDDRLDYDGAHRAAGGAPDSGPFSLVLARSRDGAATWTESVVDARIKPAERFIVFIPPTPALAVDAASGRVYAAFHDARGGDADVLLWTLGAGEGAWAQPVRVNDARRGTQYRPQLSIAPGGRLDVVYYDRRDDARDRRNEVSLQSSFDQGASFMARVKLSDRSFDSGVGPGSERGLADLGSRLASLSTSDRTLAVWTDTRAGTKDSAKQDIMRAVAVFTTAAGLEPWLQVAVRAAGLGIILAGLLVMGRGVALRRPRVKFHPTG
jgi:hypothetical protein